MRFKGFYSEYNATEGRLEILGFIGLKMQIDDENSHFLGFCLMATINSHFIPLPEDPWWFIMKKIIVIAIIGLFLGVAVAPSINADVREQDVEKPISGEDEQYLRLMELATNIVDSWETTSIDEDCGCEEQTTGLWKFPVFCVVLFYLGAFFSLLGFLYYTGDIVKAIGQLAVRIDCFWIDYWTSYYNTLTPWTHQSA